MRLHPTLAKKPPELHGLLYDFWWDLPKLHALALPTRFVATEDLLWHLDLPYWKHNEKPFQITPRQVLESPTTYPEQYARTLDSNLTYPPIVREDGDRILMVDGVHRLLKAVIEDRQQLAVAVFSDDLIPLILHD